MTWVRIDLGWASFEPTGPDRIDRAYTRTADTAVNEARAAGLHVLAMLWWTPTWASGGGARTSPPRDPGAYAAVTGWAAAHFRGRVDAWELWNEPNQTDFWTGSVRQYVTLVRAAYPAVKAADPHALVVLGAPAYNDTDYLAAEYGAGVRGAFDVLATHPYLSPAAQPPETPDDGSRYTLAHVAAVRALMVREGDAAKPIWFTEFGWSSHDNQPGLASWQQGVSPAEQGAYLVRTLRWVAQHAPYVTHAFWYEEKDQTDFDVENDHFGLLTTGLADKPAYIALRAHLRQPVATAGTGPARKASH